MPKFTIKGGLTGRKKKRLLRMAGPAGAATMIKQIDEKTRQVTEETAKKSSERAPVDTGRLRDSIPPTVEKLGKMTYQFGSDMPYAVRQEYEHVEHRGYFRRSLWEARDTYRGDLETIIKKRGKS